MLKNNRPKLKIPFAPIDVFIEVMSICLIFISILYLIFEYNDLPDTIASHFNSKGVADDYSNKIILIILPLIMIAFYVGLFILNKFPHMHNYMINITEENAFKNYQFSTRIVRVVNFLTVLLFSYIIYAMIQSAKGYTLSLGSWFLPVVIGVSIILPIVLLIYQRKINQA